MVVVAKPRFGRFHCRWHDKVGRGTRSYSASLGNGARCKPIHDRVRNKLGEGFAVIINSPVTPVEINKKVADVDKMIDPI